MLHSVLKHKVKKAHLTYQEKHIYLKRRSSWGRTEAGSTVVTEGTWIGGLTGSRAWIVLLMLLLHLMHWRRSMKPGNTSPALSNFFDLSVFVLEYESKYVDLGLCFSPNLLQHCHCWDSNGNWWDLLINVDIVFFNLLVKFNHTLWHSPVFIANGKWLLSPAPPSVTLSLVFETYRHHQRLDLNVMSTPHPLPPGLIPLSFRTRGHCSQINPSTGPMRGSKPTFP